MTQGLSFGKPCYSNLEGKTVRSTLRLVWVLLLLFCFFSLVLRLEPRPPTWQAQIPQWANASVPMSPPNCWMSKEPSSLSCKSLPLQTIKTTSHLLSPKNLPLKFKVFLQVHFYLSQTEVLYIILFCNVTWKYNVQKNLPDTHSKNKPAYLQWCCANQHLRMYMATPVFF